MSNTSTLTSLSSEDEAEVAHTFQRLAVDDDCMAAEVR
jgi:hypothetical protein